MQCRLGLFNYSMFVGPFWRGEVIKGGAIEPEIIIDPEKHQKIEQLRKIAELLDGQFRIPGTDIEFGLDAIIGLVPGIGDVISGGISMWLIREARRLGAPRWLIARMIWNVAVDVGVGIVPVFGDMLDVAWKANRMNMELLSQHFKTSSRR
ncbi:MAG: DUF4112 domain-containing protein [Schlesneria sp.]